MPGMTRPDRRLAPRRVVEVITFVEGPSDVDFFPSILRLLVETVLDGRPERSSVVVEELDNRGAARGDWVVERVRDRYRGAAVVAVHVDGSSNVARELHKSYKPVEEVWGRQVDLGARLVPLVPVRETEAWVLADLSIVRDVAGAGWGPSSVTQSHLLDRPERLSDPKRTLDDIMAQARRPRRRKRHVDTFLPLIAERLELPALRRLPSFQRFEHDLRAALTPASETTP